MSIGFTLVGRADPVGIATPEKFVRRISKWARRATGIFGLVPLEELYADANPPAVTLQFFAAAEPVEFTLEAPGVVRVTANSASMGPGYHQWLCDDMLDKLAKSLGVQWSREHPEICYDETGYFFRRDRAELEDTFLRWLGNVAQQVRQLGASEHADIMIALPPNPLFKDCGFVVTPMGPRDYVWVERVADEPAAGKDFFLWWEREASPRTRLNAVLSLMWTEVRWQAPRTEAEKRILLQIGLLLRRALQDDPDLPYPWREWQQILGWTGQDAESQHSQRFFDDQHRAEIMTVLEKGAADDPGRPLIGYRRHCQVTEQFPDGWQVTVPGSFSVDVDEQGTWIAWEPGRTVRFSRLNVQGKDGRVIPAAELLSFGRDKVDPRAHERLEGKSSYATIAPYEEDGQPSVCLTGHTAVDGSLAIVSVYYDDTRQRDWAIDVWRSIRNPQRA